MKALIALLLSCFLAYGGRVACVMVGDKYYELSLPDNCESYVLESAPTVNGPWTLITNHFVVVTNIQFIRAKIYEKGHN